MRSKWISFFNIVFIYTLLMYMYFFASFHTYFYAHDSHPPTPTLVNLAWFVPTVSYSLSPKKCPPEHIILYETLLMYVVLVSVQSQGYPPPYQPLRYCRSSSSYMHVQCTSCSTFCMQYPLWLKYCFCYSELLCLHHQRCTYMYRHTSYLAL